MKATAENIKEMWQRRMRERNETLYWEDTFDAVDRIFNPKPRYVECTSYAIIEEQPHDEDFPWAFLFA